MRTPTITPFDSVTRQPSLRASDQERRKFDAHCLGMVAARLRSGLAVAVVVALTMAVAAALSYPALAWETARPSLASAATMLFGRWLLRWPAASARAHALAGVIATAIGAYAALTAVHTGGYASPFVLVLFLVWMFIMSFLPIAPRHLAPICVPPAALFCVVLGLHGQGYAPPAVLAFVHFGGLAYAHVGVTLRYDADLLSYVAHRRLSDAQAELANLNQDLGERVQQQVFEIVERAEQIEALNTRLRADVRNRSRELALTLERLQRQSGYHELRVGDVLAGRVRIDARLGGGGMGSVHAGTELATGERVAVKVMNVGSATAEEIHRFLAEADAAASVEHPVVVRTVAVDVAEDGRPFQLLELVDGVSLRTLVHDEGRPLTLAQAVTLGRHLADALAAAHRAGVIHRDIKPSNVLLCEGTPGVRLVDFGIAKRLHVERPASAQLTAPGQVIGTPAFMAPEQLDSSRELTSAVDLYSLGALLYELLASRPLFQVQGVAALLAAHLGEAPDPLSEVAPGCPQALAEAVMACVRKRPEERPTAEQLVETLTPLVHELGVASLSELLSTAPGRAAASSGASAEAATVAMGPRPDVSR